MPFIAESEGSVRSEKRLIASALDFGVLLAAFTVTSRHTIHPDANLETLLAFAEDHDWKLSKPLGLFLYCA